jgi:hypothetical protein
MVVRLESVSLRSNPVVRTINQFPGSQLPTDQSADGRFTSMIAAHRGELELARLVLSVHSGE